MEILNRYLSGIIMPTLLMLLGIFFAFRFKFFYILHPVRTARTMIKSQKYGFRSLTVALAGTLGVGNIVGVASAILMGGAGSIFWMWISALCAMSLKYAEVYLSMVFRKSKNGQYYGGAPYYIKDGLKNKLGIKAAYALSCLFAFLCVINSLTTGNLVQINSVSNLLPISPLVFGILFTILAFLAIIGGIKRISKITSVLIPILSFAYILICLIVIFMNFSKIPSLLALIFKDAFSLKCAASGFCGYGISAALRFGVSRGVLSNEAGCGTSPCAHASSDSNDPHGQGCLGIFEVFVDTVVLCSLTAFVILLSGAQNASSPMELVMSAFEKYLGTIGSNTVLVLCVLFAFATVICQFFYGIESLRYLTKKDLGKHIFTFVFCLVLLIGSVIPMALMWQISDLAIAVMTILNLICLFLLRKNIV